MGLLDGKIAKLVDAGIKAAGLYKPATLIKYAQGTRGGTVSAGTNPTSTSYAARGFVADYTAYELAGTTVQVGDRKVILLGASMSVVPAQEDRVTIEGLTLRIINIQRDPAAAVYICQCRV